MVKRGLAFGAPFLLAITLAFAPWTSSHTAAQMGPMAGQPLDQLSGDEFDQTFLMQMTMHHAMAVVMARPLVANAQHQELKDLGTMIIEGQTREVNQMRGWLKEWYAVDMPDMIGMMDAMPPGQGMPMPPGQGMPMGQMHGMSTMADLWTLPPARLEVVFMSLMIPHHQGAIDAAMLVPDRAAHQELTDLAKSIVESQSMEIQRMNGWLASWYGL